MSRPNRSNFAAWLRGGQTIGHTVDMVREVLKRIIIVMILWGAVCIIATNVRATDDEQRYGSLSIMAYTLEWVGSPFPQDLRVPVPGLEPQRLGVQTINSLPWVAEPAARYRHLAKQGLFVWFAGWIFVLIGTGLWYTREGQRKLKTRHVRGQHIVRASELVRQIYEFNTAEARRRNRPQHIPAEIVGVPYPFDTEMEHTMLVGGPGSGKSVAFHRLIQTIRARGDKAVIYDPELEYLARHFDPTTDIILNPFDERSVSWSPFYDATDHNEWDRLAHGLFKDPKSGDPYWTSVARSLFSWTCFCLKEQDADVTLHDALNYLFGPTKRLTQLLEGTPAAKHLEGGQSPRVSSIESVLVEGVAPLVYLLGKGEPFSLRKWINQERREPGFIFLAAPETHADTLRPLLGFWSEIGVSSLLSRSAEGVPPHPTWLLFDEFPALGRIDKLAEGPQRLRKYGGAMVLGMQQVSQIQDIYGRDRARTIIGQCATKLILRASDSETAEYMSAIIGDRVMHRVTESTSYGANAIRDGVGIAPREEKERVYLPTDIMNLPKLQGVLRVSNARPGAPFPIAPISFTPDTFTRGAAPFVPRTGPDPVRAFINRAKASAGEGAPPPPPPSTTPPPAPPSPTTPPPTTGGGPVLVTINGAPVGATASAQTHEKTAAPGATPTARDRAIATKRREEEAKRLAREEAAKRQSDLFNEQRQNAQPVPPDRDPVDGGALQGISDFGREI